MNRFDKLLSNLSTEFPNDWWIQRRDESLKLGDESHQSTFDAYSSAVENLDDDSWEILKSKAERSFHQNGKDCGLRGKNEFFNLMNESFAYNHLLKLGFTRVRMLAEEGKVKTPDLSFQEGSVTSYCEVKTFSKSDKELIRTQKIESFDSSEYSVLGDGFFKKFNEQIERSKSKFPTSTKNNAVYAILHFDDLLLSFLETYKMQILTFLQSNHPEIRFYGQVGTLGKVFTK